ncbi:hypothetical protein DdX_18551 [Ditylenchus destructor]|uniref:Uncharacterized protein n=1 Tax=Ditylenchus destructor TaxID=166010 RepID=A0AAD4MKZ6_9BILA|nr:hypothetical protein DdX_18551 [Ditylenchus destructor]
MMFIFGIVFLAAASEALYHVKILDASIGMGCDFFEIITFDKPKVSRKEVWDRVSKSDYLTFREKNGYDNSDMSLQVIAPGESVKIDGKTATADLVKIEGAEIVLEMTKGEYYVATVLDKDSNMLLGHFMYHIKSTTVKEIWDHAESHTVFSKSIWNSVNEIRVEAPGHPTQKITKQTPEDTVVQVENAKFLVKVEAGPGVKHMAPFWRAKLHNESPRHYKSHKYTGLFRFHAEKMTVQEIWDAVKQEVVPVNMQGFTGTLVELRIEMAKGTKSIEVELKNVKDNAKKIDVKPITDVIYGVRTVTPNNGLTIERSGLVLQVHQEFLDLD